MGAPKFQVTPVGYYFVNRNVGREDYYGPFATLGEAEFFGQHHWASKGSPRVFKFKAAQVAKMEDFGARFLHYERAGYFTVSGEGKERFLKVKDLKAAWRNMIAA